jgi:hypothetical protein
LNALFKIPKLCLDFFGYSNLFLAIAVFASTLQGGFIFKNISLSAFSFSFLNFAAAFYLYNLQRIYQSAYPTTDERLLWYRRNKKWIFTIALLLILLLSQTFWNTFINYTQGIFVYCICAFLSLLYFLPPLSLRKVKMIKQFAIGFVWVVVCCVIPLMFHDNSYSGIVSITKDEWLYIVSQFCFISALCIPFDIRDQEKDRKEGTHSLPVVLGIQNSKWVAIGLMGIYLMLAFFIEERDLLLIRGIIFIISILLIANTTPQRHRHYFIYLTDGIIILQTLLLYFL